MPSSDTELELKRSDVKRLGQGEPRRAFLELKDNRVGNRLGFRFADGTKRSLTYLHLIETYYDPSIGVVLTFVGDRITLVGRNLTGLYYRLEEELVGEVYERHDFRDMQPAEDDPAYEDWRRAAYIEKIECEKL